MSNLKLIILVLLLSFDLLTYFDVLIPVAELKTYYYFLLLIVVTTAFSINQIKIQFNKIDSYYFVFLLSLLIRLFYDLYVQNVVHDTYGNKITYFVFYLFSIIFSFIVAKLFHFNEIEFSIGIKYWLLFLLSSSIFSLYNVMVSGNFGRVNANSILDPISLGHMGISIFFIGFFLYFTATEILKKTIWLIISLFGVFVAALSASRGPIVSLFCGLILFLTLHRNYRTFLHISVMILVVSFIVPLILNLFDLWDVNFVDRILIATMDSNADELSNGRLEIYGVAFAEILQSVKSILFGTSFVIQNGAFSGQYVHNLLLEAFMSNGLLIGCLFLYLNILAVKYSIKSIRADDFVLISLLFIQYFVGSLFSRSLLNFHLYWVFFSLVLFKNWKLVLKDK